MKKFLSVILILAILAGSALYFFPSHLPHEFLPASHAFRAWIDGTIEAVENLIWPEPEPSPDLLAYEVTRVVDGDTIQISIFSVETPVRLIGVDAPESVHPDESMNTPEGEQASLFLKQIASGKRVALEYDQELKDRYDRTLAYVYLDGIMLQDMLLSMGMARTLVIEPNTRYQHHFEMLEKSAKESGAGFWGTGFYEK